MGQIVCQGDEMSLSECQISVSRVFDYGAPPGDLAVALVCSSSSGAVPVQPFLQHDDTATTVAWHIPASVLWYLT